MKRALLIIGGVGALLIAGWYFILRKQAGPSANDKQPKSGLTLADFDPTAKNSIYGDLTRKGILLIGDKLGIGK